VWTILGVGLVVGLDVGVAVHVGLVLTAMKAGIQLALSTQGQ